MNAHLPVEERLIAAIAHASVVVSGLGILVGVVIWLTQRQKAAYAAYLLGRHGIHGRPNGSDGHLGLVRPLGRPDVLARPRIPLCAHRQAFAGRMKHSCGEKSFMLD